MLKRVSPYLLWALLAVPAAAILYEAATSDSARIYHRLVHPSGEWAAYMLILTLAATPLMLLFKKQRWPRWMCHNRRYFGVAAFGYAALHTVFYMIDKATLARIIEELPRFYIYTGWLAFAIFIPLAVTSMDYFQRKLGRHWKTLQRTTYAAAVLTLLHWASLHRWGDAPKALAIFAPLIALEAYRIWYRHVRKRPTRPAAA